MWKMIVDKIRNLLRKKPFFSIQTVRLTIMGSFLEACSKRFLPGTHWSQGCNASSWTWVPSTVDATWSNSGKTICFTIESQLFYLWCLRASKFRHHLLTIFLQIKKMLLIYIVLNILYNTLFTHTRCHVIHIPYEVNVAWNPPISKCCCCMS